MARTVKTAWPTERLLTLIGEAAPRECITEEKLAELSGLASTVIGTSCWKLRRHKLLEKTGRGCYKLTPAGRAAVAQGRKIRSGPNGPHTGVRQVKGETLRARAWRAMRIKGKFTIEDLALLSAQTGAERDMESNIGKYVRALGRAGYVRQLPVREAALTPKSNGCVRWQLVQDTGPLAPVWRASRNVVWDPNTETAQPLARELPRAAASEARA